MTEPAPPRRRAEQKLFHRLEQWRARYHDPAHLAGDPLLFPHRYTEAADREVVALLAAAFASGNIRAILDTLERLLDVMGDHPARWLADREPADLYGLFPGIGHRWVRERDVELLLALLGSTLRRHGSLGALWQGCDDGGGETVFPALEKFVTEILAADRGGLPSRERTARRTDGRLAPLAPVETILLTSPAKGSACKRMALFLRWMIRPPDGIDLGLWTHHTAPARLVMPLDVHVMRIAQVLGMTRRPQPSRRAAEEITARFRGLCPEDPCRWDFSLVRVGINEIKGKKP